MFIAILFVIVKNETNQIMNGLKKKMVYTCSAILWKRNEILIHDITYMNFENHLIVHFKRVNFMVCVSCLNKMFLKATQKLKIEKEYPQIHKIKTEIPFFTYQINQN